MSRTRAARKTKAKASATAKPKDNPKVKTKPEAKAKPDGRAAGAPPPDSIVSASDAYETWLGQQCDVVQQDLQAKHRLMAESPFLFLRATYFRWAQCIERRLPALAKTPAVVTVGDLHVENYGTWRDADGRLVWGINDFDEAAKMPYAFDLVRLATSARLVPDLRIDDGQAAEAILEGYRQGFAAPKPWVLDQERAWLRAYVECTPARARRFWQRLAELTESQPPAPLRKQLLRSLPEGAQSVRFAARFVGGGSRGRPRFVAIADWRGAPVVREAKVYVPSAWTWAHHRRPADPMLTLAKGPSRSPDPCFTVRNGLIVRRLAPDSVKLSLASIAGDGLTAQVLQAMGSDLGAIHGSSRAAAAIGTDLAAQPKGWLARAVHDARGLIEQDHADWRAHHAAAPA